MQELEKKSLFRILVIVVLSIVSGTIVVLGTLYFLNFGIVHRGARLPIKASESTTISGEKYPFLPDTTIKNVILFIGDGIGLGQITLTRIRHFGADGLMHMERMPVTGLVSTHAANNLITDSAAGATAMAIAKKTNNKMLGVTPDGKAHPGILQILQRRGLSSGIITTDDIGDATTAAFAVNVKHRDAKEEISRQMLAAKVNFLAGDASEMFLFNGKTDRKTGIQRIRDHGYQFLENAPTVADSVHPNILAHLPRMAADSDADGVNFDPQSPTLAEMTTVAIERLSKDPDGFFLLVEEEATDTGGHVNRQQYVTDHLKRLDDAIHRGLEFALRSKNTLVLVTSDHETGGMTFFESLGAPPDEVDVNWSNNRHTGQMVPIYAFGPGAIEFTGVMDNTDIPKKIARLMGIGDFWESGSQSE